jgi:hypothetical protein
MRRITFGFMLISVLLSIVLSVGCAEKVQKEFDVALSTAVMNQTEREDNKTTDIMTFLMKNNEKFALDCELSTEIINTTNKTTTLSGVGRLDAGEAKEITLRLEMLDGEAEIKITKECKRAT